MKHSLKNYLYDITTGLGHTVPFIIHSSRYVITFVCYVQLFSQCYNQRLANWQTEKLIEQLWNNQDYECMSNRPLSNKYEYL